MKLIVVTTPTFFVEEDKIITALFEEGLDVLHLRKPETPAMYSERLLTLIPDKYHRRIVTHEHFYLKEEFNLMGIHLNARNPKEPHDYYGHISCSCHSVEEVKNRKHFYDYVFMSPIYDSISKVNYYSTYTAEELREAQRAKIIDSKVMALGGINEDNLLEIKDFGFGGAVVLGDLWNKFDACQDQNYLAVIEHFKKLKKLSDKKNPHRKLNLNSYSITNKVNEFLNQKKKKPPRIVFRNGFLYFRCFLIRTYIPR